MYYISEFDMDESNWTHRDEQPASLSDRKINSDTYQRSYDKFFLSAPDPYNAMIIL